MGKVGSMSLCAELRTLHDLTQTQLLVIGPISTTLEYPWNSHEILYKALKEKDF